jgi:hypothetical protein
MGLIDWLQRKADAGAVSYKVDEKLAAAELSEFLGYVRRAEGPALALTGILTAEVAARLYTETNGKVDLRMPSHALSARPKLLWELIEGVIQLQRAGRQIEAPGKIMWTHTLRAAAHLVPETCCERTLVDRLDENRLISGSRHLLA